MKASLALGGHRAPPFSEGAGALRSSVSIFHCTVTETEAQRGEVTWPQFPSE